MTVREYSRSDLSQMIQIWNGIVEEGIAFPQEEPLDAKSADKFFGSQTYCGVAEEGGEIVGLYILHPNNVGRCAHICNASYAVKEGMRGRHIGELLVRDCIKKAPEFGFKILQFNAVVKSNKAAIHLYNKLGFTQLGTIPGGFRTKSGKYEDIIPHYIVL